MQCRGTQCSRIKFNIVHCIIVQDYTVQCNTVQCSIVGALCIPHISAIPSPSNSLNLFSFLPSPSLLILPPHFFSFLPFLSPSSSHSFLSVSVDFSFPLQRIQDMSTEIFGDAQVEMSSPCNHSVLLTFLSIREQQLLYVLWMYLRNSIISLSSVTSEFHLLFAHSLPFF